MTYYHCSPTSGMTILEPQKPEFFAKPAAVYLTSLLPMALLYGVRNYEYSYGYTREKQIYFDEYFPNALEILYRGKSASLYLCNPQTVRSTQIPNEVVSDTPVEVMREVPIPDVCEALLAQERMGTLIIRRYHTLSQKMLDWIRQAEADTIRGRQLLQKQDSMSVYYKSHYPESWAMVEMEK